MGALKKRPLPGADDDMFFGWDIEGQMRVQWVVAVLAVFVSLLLHAIMAWAASRVDFSFLGRNEAQGPTRRFEVLTVDRLDPDEKSIPILNTLRASEDVASPGVALEAGLDSLQMPLDTAAIAPPALRPPEANTEDIPALSGADLPFAEIAWEPRQEILAIEAKAVAGPDMSLPRRTIPRIERVPVAPDVVLPIEAAVLSMRVVPEERTGLQPFRITSDIETLPAPGALLDMGPSGVTARGENEPELFEEEPDVVTDVAPIEDALVAEVETFVIANESHGYFRLTIGRSGPTDLPVMPKDVLLVQDTSATIAERRLHFSREGFRRGFAYITAQDRFNIATFVDRTSYAFPDWAFRSSENDAVAQQYLRSMRAAGNTDFLAAMRDILALENDLDRPVIAIVVTDGLMHSGVTDSTEVIARFTRENSGRMSIFTLGVADYANQYLLDMLSHFNMGEARYVQAGRWDIPDDLVELIRSVSRPVLGDLLVRFGADTGIEGYPLRPGNLYLDRPLVIYGRFARNQERLVFHAAGRAGAQRSDMVFDLPLPAPQHDVSIRDGWSQQKMYRLIALYTQTRDRQYLREMRTIARRYGHPVPFRTFFGL